MCAYSLDHITPSRLGAIVFANSYNDYSIRIQQDPRLSLYDTFDETSSQTLATSHVFKEQNAGFIARFVSLCALSFHCACSTGGASRDRTDDPLLAKQVLSQLSYGPVRSSASCLSAAEDGGSRRTRTSDLTLIRGAL